MLEYYGTGHNPVQSTAYHWTNNQGLDENQRFQITGDILIDARFCIIWLFMTIEWLDLGLQRYHSIN